MLGFCAMLLVILWLLQTVFLTDMYKYIRKKEIEKAVAYVEQNINTSDLRTIFQELEMDKDIIVMFTRDFVTPQWWENERENRSRPAEIIPEAITQTIEFVLQDGSTVSFTFFAMITPVNATISTLKTQLYFLTVIMILLSIIIAIVISRRISKPIEDINRSAKVLAGGSYDAHFNGKGFLEIRELSDTLNTAATELSKVENLRRELLANVSHDLRTPLALIYSYAEMMNDFPNEITPQQTQIIMDEARRLTSLVNDILDISQFETKDIELHKSNYCLTESIASTINRTMEFIKNDGYTVDFDSSSSVYVNADEVKITQAFYNLLINAINYSGEDKKIIVRQSISDGQVKVEVIDNGTGISAEDLLYVWDRYYKADKKHKRPVTGTGLGLSIVKKIIEMHGGRCGVISEIGKGSAFWFEININKSSTN